MRSGARSLLRGMHSLTQLHHTCCARHISRVGYLRKAFQKARGCPQAGLTRVPEARCHYVVQLQHHDSGDTPVSAEDTESRPASIQGLRDQNAIANCRRGGEWKVILNKIRAGGVRPTDI